MTASHPIAGNPERTLKLSEVRHDWVRHVIGQCSTDELYQRRWMGRKVHFYQRRHQRAWAKPTFPWRGSSDVVVPLSDMQVSEQTSVQVMTFFPGRHQAYRMIPESQASVATAAVSTGVMNDLIHRRVPNFKREIAYGIDSSMMLGTGIWKTGYSFKTRRLTETISKRTLPSELARVIVVDEIDSEQQLRMAQEFGVEVITKGQFDANAGRVEDMVEAFYGLDLTDRGDRKVLRDIMGLIRNGGPDAEVLARRRQVIEDTPTVEMVPIDQLIVPAGIRDIQHAPRLQHRLFVNEATLIERKLDEKWVPEAVDAILNKGSAPQPTSRVSSPMDLMRRESYSRAGWGAVHHERDDQFELRETYALMMPTPEQRDDGMGDGDGPVPVVMLTDKSGDVVLSMQELPWHHGEWNFVVMDREWREPGYGLSRGIGEVIENQERHATALARAELNNLLWQVSSMFTLEKGSGILPKDIKPAPGLILPVMRGSNLTAIDRPVTALALEQPMRAQIDFAERLTGSQNPQKTRDQRLLEPITATQGNIEEQARQRSSGMTALIAAEALAQIGRHVFENFRQFGPHEFDVQTAGEEIRRVSQRDILGRYTVVPEATIGESDPEFRRAKAMENVSVAAQLQPLIADDPQFEFDFGEIVTDLFDASDPTASRRYLRRRSEEEIQQIVQGQQATAQQMQELRQIAEALNENVPVSEQQALKLAQFLQRVSPFGGFQRITEAADQSRRAAQRGQGVVS